MVTLGPLLVKLEWTLPTMTLHDAHVQDPL